MRYRLMMHSKTLERRQLNKVRQWMNFSHILNYDILYGKACIEMFAFVKHMVGLKMHVDCYHDFMAKVILV